MLYFFDYLIYFLNNSFLLKKKNLTVRPQSLQKDIKISGVLFVLTEDTGQLNFLIVLKRDLIEIRLEGPTYRLSFVPQILNSCRITEITFILF